VNAADADAVVAARSPVPGGVGTVTTAVLMSHIVDAAMKVSQ
jgi:methylenetetrahydrofolate dehydrogenase (NADP+)/methenyltetrahydrofolate cyclohydrolase